MNGLKEKFGLATAISMVVGIVIGSGVFFKADDVLIATNGNLPLAILAWLIGGSIMVVSAYTFSLAARRISKSNGIVDYVEAGYGEKAGFYVGYFMAYIYYPTLTGVLAWVSGLYTSILFGVEGYGLWYFALFYLLVIVLLNYLSPILSGKFQVSATVIKLIPLSLVAVVGLIVGFASGLTVENFTTAAQTVGSSGGGLATAVLATAFAYEGWIVATSINSELRDAKKTLPKALVIGSLIVIVTYITYYVGLAGTLSNEVFAVEGDNAMNIAVNTLFGSFAGTALTVFVIISCLGTLNGLMLGTSRSVFSLAIRNKGFAPIYFSKTSEKSNAPTRSVVLSLIIMALWGLVWFGNFEGWFNGFLDTSELPIAFLYAIYLLVYVWIIRSFTDLNIWQRYVAPIASSVGSLYIVYAAVQKDLFVVFTLITVVIFVSAFVSELVNKASNQDLVSASE
jgi:APA family basic amino acid/polyamine antiporter